MQASKIKNVIGLFVLLFHITANSAINQSGMMIDTSEPKKSENVGIAFLVTGYPVPIVQSEGMGFGISYLISPTFEAAIGYNKMSKGQNNDYFGEEKKDTNIFYTANLKAFILPVSFGSMYLAGGYQQGEVQSFYRPALFGGFRADSKTPYNGATAAVGFQAKANENFNIEWVFDASVTYAPGTNVDSNYVVDEIPSLNNLEGRAHLDTKLSYGFQPLLLVGARF